MIFTKNTNKIPLIKPGRALIGTSGWSYKHWADGVFYPHKLPQREWLAFYSEHFRAVEVNSTFYHLLKKPVFEKWRLTVPDDFLFVIKANRYITHLKRLTEPESGTARFLEDISALDEKLGPALVQLPPSLTYDSGRLQNFLHVILNQKIIPHVRIALEVRHASWLNDEAFEILRQNNVALCFADWPGLNVDSPVTADFIYLRRHGPGAAYSSDYSAEMLQKDAYKIAEWNEKGMDVFVFFNNDISGYAIKNAKQLKALLAESSD